MSNKNKYIPKKMDDPQNKKKKYSKKNKQDIFGIEYR